MIVEDFSAAAVAVKQRVLRGQPVQERYGILYDLIALKLVILRSVSLMGSMCSTGISFPPRNVNALYFAKSPVPFFCANFIRRSALSVNLPLSLLRKRRVVGGRACDIRKRLLYR